MFVVLLVAGGMSGGNCFSVIPQPDGSGGGGPSGGPTILPTDHVIGNADASVTIVEYLDYQCPFCGAFARSEFPTLKTQYVDTGLVRWVFRHYPLASHNRAEPAAEAAECAADQGNFEDYHDLLFDISGNLSDAKFGEYADMLGLDRTQFDACIAGTSKINRVQQDVTSGNALGVSSTPVFFVNEDRVPGFQTAAQLSDIIDRKLTEVGG